MATDSSEALAVAFIEQLAAGNLDAAFELIDDGARLWAHTFCTAPGHYDKEALRAVLRKGQHLRTKESLAIRSIERHDEGVRLAVDTGTWIRGKLYRATLNLAVAARNGKITFCELERLPAQDVVQMAQSHP